MKILKHLYTLLLVIVGGLLFGTLLGGADATLTVLGFVLSAIGGVALAYGYQPTEKRFMAYACGAITAGVTLNCSDPLSSGVVATFYLANKADIASITYDVANPMLATDITMVATKTFFTFEGNLQSTEPKFTMIKGKYINQFEHSVSALIFKIDPTTKEEILNMKDGDFVAIVENNYTGSTGNSKYEIYGAGSGLKAEILERNPNDTENLGAFKIELKTQEYAREGKPPVTLFDTDLATTDALVAGLL
jgi:lipoprotein signal peptidase